MNDKKEDDLKETNRLLNSIRKLLITIVCISSVILLFVWFIYMWMPEYY